VPNIEDVKSEIGEIKSLAAEAKQEHDQAEGAIRTYNEQLMTNHKIKSLAAAKKFIDKENAALDSIKKDIISDFEELKKESGIEL